MSSVEGNRNASAAHDPRRSGANEKWNRPGHSSPPLLYHECCRLPRPIIVFGAASAYSSGRTAVKFVRELANIPENLGITQLMADRSFKRTLLELEQSELYVKTPKGLTVPPTVPAGQCDEGDGVGDGDGDDGPQVLVQFTGTKVRAGPGAHWYLSHGFAAAANPSSTVPAVAILSINDVSTIVNTVRPFPCRLAAFFVNPPKWWRIQNGTISQYSCTCTGREDCKLSARVLPLGIPLRY